MLESHEEALTSWERAVMEIGQCFGDSTAKRKAEHALLQKAQASGETCTAYIERVLQLFPIVNSEMSEEDKVVTSLNIAENVYKPFTVPEDLMFLNIHIMQKFTAEVKLGLEDTTKLLKYYDTKITFDFRQAQLRAEIRRNGAVQP